MRSMTILTPTTSLDQSREAHPLPPPTMLHVPNIYHPTKRILCNMGPCCIRIETSRATKETRRPYEGSLKRQAMFSVNGWIFPLCRKRIFLVLFFIIPSYVVVNIGTGKTEKVVKQSRPQATLQERHQRILHPLRCFTDNAFLTNRSLEMFVNNQYKVLVK